MEKHCLLIDMAPSDADTPFGYGEMNALRREHRERATASYSDALSKLWLGNGAGTVGAVSALGAAASAKLPLHKWYLLCPSAFALGLVLLGIGIVATLVSEAKWLNDHEEAMGILDLRVDGIRRPTHEIGLDFSNYRTVTAIGAAISFLAGIIIAGIAIHEILPT